MALVAKCSVWSQLPIKVHNTTLVCRLKLGDQTVPPHYREVKLASDHRFAQIEINENINAPHYWPFEFPAQMASNVEIDSMLGRHRPIIWFELTCNHMRSVAPEL